MPTVRAFLCDDDPHRSRLRTSPGWTLRRYTVYVSFGDDGMEEIDVDAAQHSYAERVVRRLIDERHGFYVPGGRIVDVQERHGLYV
jgi:hypothetical protein